MNFLPDLQALVVELVCLENKKCWDHKKLLLFFNCLNYVIQSWLRNNIPRTTSLDVASVVANSFLSLILTSPLSLRWHLLRSSRLWVEERSILTPGPSKSSISSLNHCTLIGSFPENGSLKMAFSPALMMTASENLPMASASIFGGSKYEWREFHFCKIMVVYVIWIKR